MSGFVFCLPPHAAVLETSVRVAVRQASEALRNLRTLVSHLDLASQWQVKTDKTLFRFTQRCFDLLSRA